MSFEIEKLIDALKSADWSLNLKQQQLAPNLGEKIISRYPKLPKDYISFLSKVTHCSNRDQTAWFLCENDFKEQSDSAYKWNEFEIQSLTTAATDESWKNEITSFWSNHLPIFISVKSGYAYLALSFSSDGKEPSVVYGCEPEYEESLFICRSFSELADLVLQVVNGKHHEILSRIL